MVGRSALIVGGSGQVGLATADSLQRADYDVTIAHRGGGSSFLDGTDFRRVLLDREETAELSALSRQYDVVVDCVAYNKRHARQWTGLVGEIESLVVISTGSVYLGTNGSYFDVAYDDSRYPIFPVPVTETTPTVDNAAQTYGALKAAMERELLACEGLPVSILRPAAVHGPHSPKLREWFFIKRILDRRPHLVLARSGENRFSTSSTLNIAELVLACCEQPGNRALNAVDEEGYSYREIAAAVAEVMGRGIEVYAFDGPPVGNLGATPWDAPYPFVCSMEKARDEVNYVPAVTYKEAVTVDVEWIHQALSSAERRGDSWETLFPRTVNRYGPEGWFPYELEDAWVRQDRMRELL